MWLPVAVYDGLEAGAAAAGVDTGSVAREAVLRAHSGVLADVSAGRVKLRARSARLPVAGADRKPSAGLEESAPVSSSAGSGLVPVGDASAALLAPAPRAPRDPGVERALAFRRVAARQAAERRGL